jgi:cytosine/adenosine deaminase-related metal-dependent hydrolase
MPGMKLKADRIFDGCQWLESDRVLITDANGQIVDIIPEAEAGEDIMRYKGTLCPGFVNVHGHLELSHLQGHMLRGTGLPGFLTQVIQQRGFDPAQILDAMFRVDREMYQAGIQAMGDICNTADSIPVKAASRIRWYNFIEVLSSRDEGAAQRLAYFTEIRDRFRETRSHIRNRQPPSPASLAPHAPYSVSPLSFQNINLATTGETVSLHSQESQAEDELFRHGTGPFLDFYRSIGLTENPVSVTGKSSLMSVLPYFNGRQRIILVHNTYTTEDDLSFADNLARERGLSIHYCLCPNANLFIEGSLPPVSLLLADDRNIVIGTDSLASNDGLSIASELNTLLKAFPSLSVEQVLKWATSNGAAALGFENELGGFRIGKTPGVILLDDQLSVQRIC